MSVVAGPGVPVFDRTDINTIAWSGIFFTVLLAAWSRVQHVRLRRESRRVASRDGMVARLEQLERARRRRMKRSPAAGAVLVLLGILLWPFYFLLVNDYNTHHLGINRRGPVAGLVVASVALASGALLTRGRQMRLKDPGPGIFEGPQPPIVYLRPFGVDRFERRIREIGRWMMPKPSAEQRIRKALRPVGPLIALGDPTDALPALGAHRLYVDDEQWQRTAEDLIGRGGTVILTAYVEPGGSEGLAWEIRHLVALDQPERLVLIAAPLESSSLWSSARYETFRDTFGKLFPRGLPPSIGEARFIWFDADWSPRLFGGPDTADAELPSATSVPAQQRTAVLNRLHAAFDRHSVSDAVVNALRARTGLTRRSVRNRLAFLSFLVNVLGIVAMVWVAVHTGRPPALPAGYAEFRDRDRHTRLGVPEEWIWLDPADSDIRRRTQETLAAIPGLPAVKLPFDNLRFMAAAPDGSAWVSLIVWRKLRASDLNLPQLCAMSRDQYEKAGGLVRVKRVRLAGGHKGCQITTHLPFVDPSGDPTTLDSVQDLVVVNDRVYLLSFGGDSRERAAIESTLDVL